VAREADPGVEVRLLFQRAPLLCDREDRIAQCVRSAATEVCGRAPAERGVGYWMDAALFAAAGISTVNYGPTGAGAHEAVEWVDADSVESCARVLARAARAFCGSTDPQAAKGQGSK
jgi:acetylornithine deacetylase